MRKICPKCHRVQQDERIIACEMCREPFISLADGARLLSKDEITALASAIFKDWRIKLLLKAFPVVVLAGVAAAALFLNWSAAKRLKIATAEIERTSSNEVQKAFSAATNEITSRFQSLQQSTSNEVVAAYATATNQIAAKFDSFKINASNQISEAYVTVTNQIAETFREPNIRRTVESVAKNEAKFILEEEVQPVVRSFTNDAAFIRTVARAQAYDFKAFQGLLEIGKGTNDNAKLANQIVAEIDRSLVRDHFPFSPQRIYMEVKGTNFYRGPFASDELAFDFENMAQDKTSFNREGMVNTISALKQPLFLPMLVKLFTNETDLGVADRAAIAISDLSKQDFRPHDFEQVITWWNKHHDSYTNWPLETFERGFHEFRSVHYSQAAEAFEQVLKIDSGADMSRALAIACLWESGETNRAVKLAKEFKNPSARWAQWASAKADLEAGNISNATTRFFGLTTNFPSMSLLPNQSDHVFRKIDWQLFNRLKDPKLP